MSNVTVLIAGAGPVGLALAVELTRWSVPCRIVEKAAAATPYSKALVVWPRTLEHFATAGCAAEFLDSGRPITRAEIRAGARRIARIDFTGIETPYPYALFVPQSETERLLEEYLGRLGVTVERHIELTGFTPGPDSVVATLRRDDGGAEHVAADYLVGCDGAHSAVRHGLGMEFSGVSEQGVWMLGDLQLRGPGAGDELGLYWHRRGVLAIFPMKAGRVRIIAELGPANAAPKEATLALIQTILDQRGPGGLTAHDPVWLSLFHINERKVADYRRGRVFLAGDAAHIHSPAGGQGMNTGIQDAVNLAWKLALVSRGRARSVLLDTYSPERSAVGAMVLRNATNLTRIATIRNPLLQALRNAAAWLLMKLPPVRRGFATAMTELNIAYPQSALSRGGGGKLKPGSRAPDAAFLDAGGEIAQLFDAFHRTGFTLLEIGGPTKTAGAKAGIAGSVMDNPPARFGDLVKTIALGPAQDVAGELAQRYGSGLYLIRPDGYIGLASPAGDLRAAEKYLATWLKG